MIPATLSSTPLTFKKENERNGYQSTYPGMPHGAMNFAAGWNHAADSAVNGSPVAANLDNDWTNGLEAAFASTLGTLYAVDNAGQPLWSANIGATLSTPAIGDIDDRPPVCATM